MPSECATPSGIKETRPKQAAATSSRREGVSALCSAAASFGGAIRVRGEMRKPMSWLLALFTLCVALLVGFHLYAPPAVQLATTSATASSLRSPSTTSHTSPPSSAPSTSQDHLSTTSASSMSAPLVAPAKMYPALYICHGGGPMPLLNDPDHIPMMTKWKEHVKDIVGRYGPPKAIAVVSAHYQTATPEVGGCPQPEMYYDYGGFPPETYKIQYPAPGAPELAAKMVSQMQQAGLPLATVNPKRRYDHGVFVPLLAMFPNASIPVIPVSVLQSNSPAEHIQMGQALRSLREQGVFFIGSGSSMHHFDRFGVKDAGKRLGDAMTAVLEDANLTKEARLDKMKGVQSFPGFSDAQPPRYHEHLMPLLTLLGTADGGPGREVANIPFFAANVRHYMFEE